MAILDMKFGVYVNLGSFKSIMKGYEKKSLYNPAK
jgi:hypothetical protein